MNEAILQVLLILAYLAIGLISVTFPVYAIAVNFLPQQKWEGEKEQKKRIDELRKKISQISNELVGQEIDSERIDKLREQLDNYENELTGTELKYKYLTAKGAVLVPVVVLLVALVFSITGLYTFYKDLREWAIGLGAFSGLCSTVALYRLLKTVSAIEYGALRPERTVEFEIGFVPELLGVETHPSNTITMAVGVQATLSVGAKTSECDLENFEMTMFVPAEIKIVSKIVNAQNITKSDYKDMTVLSLYRNCVMENLGTALRFSVIPLKAGKYSISVKIGAKGIYSFQKELFILVV